jgi:hypothetical protein
MVILYLPKTTLNTYWQLGLSLSKNALQSAVTEAARKRNLLVIFHLKLKAWFQVLWTRSVNFSLKLIKSLHFCIDFNAINIEKLQSISDARNTG